MPVWPDMADGVALFYSMATQWHWVSAGMGGAFQAGLKYETAEVVARSIGIPMIDGKIPPAVFLDLQALEAETLRYWSAKRK